MAVLQEAALDFLSWWRRGLSTGMPERMRQFFWVRPRRIVLSVEGERARVIEEGFPRSGETASVPVGIDDAIETAVASARRRGAQIELRLPFASAFARTVVLPASARKHFAQMLALDLTRSAPFRAADIYTAYHALPVSRSRHVDVQQLVVKRSIVDPLVARVKAAGAAVSALSCWDASGTAALPAAFWEDGGQSRRSGRTIMTAYAVILLALVALPAAALVYRYDEELGHVRSALAGERQAAGLVQQRLQRARQILDLEVQLRRIKETRAPPTEVIEHLARILPDTAHLTELRIDGDVVEFAGLARSAAQLPQLLEKSGKFTEASLTSPLTLDGQEAGERFGLRARFRAGAAAN